MVATTSGFNATNTAIVIIHGAWHKPMHYATLTSAFESAGFKVACPHLPSTKRNRKSKFVDDVSTAHAAIAAMLDKGMNVAVVAHSYGGFVMTQALEGLPLKSASSSTSSDKPVVLAAVYLCAFALGIGQSTSTMTHGSEAFGLPRGPDLADAIQYDDGDHMVRTKDVEDIFYNKIDDMELIKHYLSELEDMPLDTFVQTLTWTPYGKVPCGYIVCEDDNAIPVSWQKYMARKNGVPVIRTLKAAHSPWAHHASEIVQIVQGMLAGDVLD